MSFCFWSFVLRYAKYWPWPFALLFFSPEVFVRLVPATFHLMMTSPRTKTTQCRFVSGVSLSGMQSTGCGASLCFSSLQRSLWGFVPLPWHLTMNTTQPQRNRNKRSHQKLLHLLQATTSRNEVLVEFVTNAEYWPSVVDAIALCILHLLQPLGHIATQLFNFASVVDVSAD